MDENQQLQANNQQAGQLDPADRNANRIPQPQYVRAPPLFKHNNDFILYERRFRAYADAIVCPEENRVHLLLSMLDDNVLGAIDRYVTPQTTLDQLCELIKDSEGYNRHNREQFAKELRVRKRERNETIREFYQALHRIALRAYPASEEIREAILKESFLSNMNDSYIAARCRERHDLDNEQILQLAITLHSCKEASRSGTTQPATAYFVDAETESEDSVSNGPNQKSKGKQRVKSEPNFESAKLDALVRMIEKMDSKMTDQSAENKPIPGTDNRQKMYSFPNHIQQDPYQYQGNRTSIGLPWNASGPYFQNQTYNNPYQDPRYQQNHRTSRPQNFQSRPWSNNYNKRVRFENQPSNRRARTFERSGSSRPNFYNRSPSPGRFSNRTNNQESRYRDRSKSPSRFGNNYQRNDNPRSLNY